MRIPTTIANWIADAEGAYVESLDRWFPDDFDRAAFCGDTPLMAERLGERWASSTAAAAKARLEELALSAFRGAYLGALALVAAYDAEADPRDALDRLTRPLSDTEHDLLDERLAEDVAVVESGLALDAARRGDASPRAAAALELARRVADPLRAILAPGLSTGAKALLALGAKRLDHVQGPVGRRQRRGRRSRRCATRSPSRPTTRRAAPAALRRRAIRRRVPRPGTPPRRSDASDG